MLKRFKQRFLSWQALCSWRNPLLLVLFPLFFSLNGYAQVVEITGIVKESATLLLPGVSVTVVGSKKVVQTNSEGAFKIQAARTDSLRFSFVGYKTKVLAVGMQDNLVVTLEVSADNALDDVVITALGSKQRKEAIVGSVTTISAKDIKIPASNLTTALAGKMAGMIAFQRSGEPGADDAQFFIRGVTTFGVNNVPLILIDNIELTTTDLARLQPDDIASFSILKDASATALYGARGANGVILVSTKMGKEGRVKVNFRLENAVSASTRDIKLVDGPQYMQLFSEAQLTRGDLEIKYNQNQIDETLAGANPYVYPNVNWRQMLLKDYTTTQRGNFSVSGGGKIAQYYVSGSASVDNGILKVPEYSNFNNNIKLKSYQLRSNINLNITPTTQMVVRLHGSFDDYNGPIDGGDGVYRKILQTSPAAYPAFYLPDAANANTKHILFGNYNTGSHLNPYADMVKGYKEYSQSKMLAQFELSQDLKGVTEGLSFRSILSTNRYAHIQINRNYDPYYYNVASYDKNSDTYSLTWLNENSNPTEFLDYSEGLRKITTQFYLLAAVDYTRVFANKHNFSGSLIYTQQQDLNPNPTAESPVVTLQLSLPHRNIGLSGRAGYAYDNKYFAEFNFGYNGSERFYKDHQFGFFPTLGLGWLISRENFFKPLSNFFTKLKLRGSFGMVGNDAIGNANQRFMYLSNVNLNNATRGYRFGFNSDTNINGVSISDYGNTDITWEKSFQKNLALEIGIDSKFNMTAEIYQQRRKNILMARASVPTTMGLSATTYANVGEAESHGAELSVDHTINFNKDFWMIFRGNFTFATNKYVKFEEPQYEESYLSKVGNPLSQSVGYIAERLFIDEEDIRNSPKQNFGLYSAGDIKFRDINGDNQITTRDRVPLGHPRTPEIIYGFGFSTGFKRFDFSAFFQGAGRTSFWIDVAKTAPFIDVAETAVGENAMLQAFADSHWSEENRDIYALWPRLSVTNSANNNQLSTWFMRNGSFLRIKSVELGYTLPEKVLNRFKLSNFRLYLSGQNLITFSSFKLWDPEMGGNGLSYPIQRIFNLGLNINL